MLIHENDTKSESNVLLRALKTSDFIKIFRIVGLAQRYSAGIRAG